MLSFKSLSEKKTKVKINPKKEDITEGSGDDVDLKKNHGDDCDCMKCESKRRKEDIDEAKVDKLVPDHKRSGKRLERYGNPHGSLALGGGIQRDRRADHAERRGKKTRGLKEVIQMTKKAYNKLHKDFKSDDPKKPRTTKYVPGKGTVSMPVKFVDEAKVDKGRSDYGKASIRNYRRKGPGHDDPGMFDPEGKRGKTIELRRKEHKERRGVKGAKVPAYKREDVEMEGTSYGIYKGDGKPKGAMAAFVKKAKKKKDAIMSVGTPPTVKESKGHKGDDSFIEGETGSKRARRDTTAAMNRSGMGYAKVGRAQKERQERHKADRGKKTKGTKAGHSGSAYPQRSHTIDTMYPHKKTARLKAKAAAMKKEDYGYAEIYPDNKVQIDEISADLALKASKKAEVERGKAAVAGNKERAIEKMKQSSRLYAKQAKKRRMEAK